MNERILIVEDEPAIAENLVYALETEGFTVRRAATAQEGLVQFAREAADLVILDVGLPDMSGFDLCKRLRAASPVPIFFLTARSEEVDRIVGLEIGADDYIAKPFSPREVTARVKALFRRLAAHAAPASASGPFTIDEPRRRILFRGAPLDLSRYELGILQALVERPGVVFSRAQLMEKVWEEPDMSLERTVDSHVKAIRAKIRVLDAETDWIETHRGFGYSLKAHASTDS
jgi:two-component system, OmpR family, catabolic regulation response regulator CreB